MEMKRHKKKTTTTLTLTHSHSKTFLGAMCKGRWEGGKSNGKAGKVRGMD